MTVADAADELIVLVDERGRPRGSADKWSSHHAESPLHLAFSCYVFDDDGWFLATRRSLLKKVAPGVWGNSVCGHPRPGESMVDAIERRLHYELGMTARDIRVVLPRHTYRTPPIDGIVEHEFCPVYIARAASEPVPNGLEVGACVWIEWEEFVGGALTDTTGTYSWWCRNQLRDLAGAPVLRGYARPARRWPIAP